MKNTTAEIKAIIRANITNGAADTDAILAAALRLSQSKAVAISAATVLVLIDEVKQEQKTQAAELTPGTELTNKKNGFTVTFKNMVTEQRFRTADDHVLNLRDFEKK